jgi:branched-chain amino acid transport system substrate-binding protein
VPKGLEGVCIPSTWTPTDHRGTMTVSINRGNLENGKVKIEKVADTVLKREDRWLGQ